MKIAKKFNKLTLKEYLFYIENHKKYTDFNTLGLYRSIVENEKLSLDEKLKLREFAHTYFKKAFDFLQLKDPYIFVKVSTLGQELTVADENQIWSNVISNQEKILKDKKIKHRSFGNYSKHNCGDDDCPYNGLMIKQNSIFRESMIHFQSDKNRYAAEVKAEKRRKDKRNISQKINKLIEDE